MVVREIGKSAAYDKIAPKELILGLKKWCLLEGAYADHPSTGVPSPESESLIYGIVFFHTNMRLVMCITLLLLL